MDKETARKNDFFKAMFEPEIKLPERPCPPTPPPKWEGPFMDLKE